MKVFKKYYFLILAVFCGVLKADLNDFRSKLSQYQKDVNNTDLLASLVDSYLMLNIQEIQRANQSLKQAGLDIVKLRQKSEEVLSGRVKKLELQAQTKDKQRNKIAADLSKAQDEIKALEKKLEAGKVSTREANLQLEIINRQLDNIQTQNAKLQGYLHNYSQAIESILPKNTLIGSEDNFGGKRFLIIGQNGLLEKLKNISSELAGLTSESPDFENKQKEYNKIIADFKDSLSECNVNKETIKEEVEELRQKNDNLNKTKTDLETLVKNLEEQLKLSQNATEKLELIKKFQDASAEINKLTKEKEYLILRVRELTSEISRLYESKSA